MSVQIGQVFVQEASQLIHVFLQLHHVGLVLIAKIQVDEQELEQAERLFLVVFHMNQQNANNEAQPLTISNLGVENRVGFENVEERQLTATEFLGEITVRGKRATEIEQNGVLMNRRVFH